MKKSLKNMFVSYTNDLLMKNAMFFYFMTIVHPPQISEFKAVKLIFSPLIEHRFSTYGPNYFQVSDIRLQMDASYSHEPITNS